MSATAAPYECPTSVKGFPARAKTGSRSATSSRSPTSRSVGHAGLFPAPYESGASTRNVGARHSISARHWLELLAFECRQTTPGPAPTSRKNGVSCCILDARASTKGQHPVRTGTNPLPPLRSVKVLDQLCRRTRYLQSSIETEQAYVHWLRAYVHSHGLRHPATRGGAEGEGFLSWVANVRRVSASTQHPARTALLRFCGKVLRVDHRFFFPASSPW